MFIHKYAGILSAYGIALADIVHEETIPCSMIYDKSNIEKINKIIEQKCNKCKEVLTGKGFSEDYIRYEIYLNLRYDRTDFSLMVSCSNDGKIIFCTEDNYRNSFLEQYKREFGFLVPNRAILLDDIRVRSSGFIDETYLPKSDNTEMVEPATLKVHDKTRCYFEHVGYQDTPIYLFDDLRYGHCIQGPAIIIESNSTMLIEPFCKANVTKQKNIYIDIQTDSSHSITTQLDPIYLSLFSHIFMGIAEQMGSVLRHTAISTNIKERLDFSCAIFSAEGHLVSNAPHIPVHLGSMGKVVQFLFENIHDMKSGDVYLTNHPLEGGIFRLLIIILPIK